ncbi:acetyl-CoA carboxylase biotin carboxyl carrier protein [Rhodospirillaceae bacterium SYSU D60014]|uniref:acetyl-CoA carboxylase biotin carboxyl carrier protein n=1 Tax=Virgifigura deserti TaxID=2268457 RepID=UPI000E65FBEA
MPKFDVDESLVRKLAGLLEETGLNEIEYEISDQRIRVTRGGATMIAAAQAAPMAQAPAMAGAAPAAAPSDAPPAGAVLSPMVGTVYVSPEPGAPPYVKVGDQVAEGQTLLIVEAMKVMNPIPAPRAGKVEQILVSDAQPVEYGDVLLVVQ